MLGENAPASARSINKRLVTSDGSIMMNCQELATLAEEGEHSQLFSFHSLFHQQSPPSKTISERDYGHIIDFNAASMVIEVTNDSRKIDSFCDIMQKYGIIEIIRTGEISLSVEPISFTEFI